MKRCRDTESEVLTMGLTDSTSARSQINQDATNSEIARRAYERFLERGAEHGHDLDDWLEAEHEVRSPTSQLA